MVTLNSAVLCLLQPVLLFLSTNVHGVTSRTTLIFIYRRLTSRQQGRLVEPYLLFNKANRKDPKIAQNSILQSLEQGWHDYI